MPSIDEIIKQQINPFDTVNFKAGNFWSERQDETLTVRSIHQREIAEIESMIELVAHDHRSRTILLLGDPGSGKSYLLARLKKSLNAKAFFAYIGPWADSDYIWRHTLRYTVDSLMHVPEGQADSQLMLWLRSLSVFTKRTLKQRVFDDHFWEVLQSDRQKFIKHLRTNYQKSGIFNADIFFSVLHSLTDPELYPLACAWLRGDDLSDESMQALKVKHCVDSEDDAKNILANFGRISAETQPIVLCFDNLDNIPKLTGNLQDFPALFNINTTIHNELFKNFLVIMSVIRETWDRNLVRIPDADQYRIDKQIRLKSITIEQAKELWAYQLRSLHCFADKQPVSNIYPLTYQLLENTFRGGKTFPRWAMMLGQREYQRYKLKLLEKEPLQSEPQVVAKTKPVTEAEKLRAEFQLFWQQEYKKTQARITKISHLSAPELIQMVKEVLEALKVQKIKPKLLTGSYASYSLSYPSPQQKGVIGIVWSEDSNMRSFFDVMNACRKSLDRNACQTLYLIRAASIGNPKLEGHRIYKQVFTGQHRHIKPDLTAVQILETYHSLVNAALARELVLTGKTIYLPQLQELLRESNVLQDCRLLQELGLIAQTSNKEKIDVQPVKEYLFNLVTTQQFMGRKVLSEKAIEQFSQSNHSEIDQLISQLCQENRIRIINPSARPEAQTVCLL